MAHLDEAQVDGSGEHDGEEEVDDRDGNNERVEVRLLPARVRQAEVVRESEARDRDERLDDVDEDEHVVDDLLE